METIPVLQQDLETSKKLLYLLAQELITLNGRNDVKDDEYNLYPYAIVSDIFIPAMHIENFDRDDLNGVIHCINKSPEYGMYVWYSFSIGMKPWRPLEGQFKTEFDSLLKELNSISKDEYITDIKALENMTILNEKNISIENIRKLFKLITESNKRYFWIENNNINLSELNAINSLPSKIYTIEDLNLMDI